MVSRSRMPPPSCTGISSPITLTISRDRELVLRLARDRAVEVDQMQPLARPARASAGHRRRILGKHRRVVHLALLQAHAMAVLDVDRGNDLHGGGETAERGGTGLRTTRLRRARLAPSVPGNEIGEQLQAGAVAFFRMELRREDISPGNGASKRQRVVGRARDHRRIRAAPDGSCARSRSAYRPECPPTAGAPESAAPGSSPCAAP